MQLRITRIDLTIAPTVWLAHDQHHHHLEVNRWARGAIQAVTEPAASRAPCLQPGQAP